ncbi:MULTISPECIES: bifunctional helix-turn-helix transcriptional regulator/GNAT family N-acetyltransferase [Thioclava]|uniref:bifunctional helix-turn-helix transcriptional regulator/GNAT family N-acetyltransferase n=1 Tax=Thioclava TaxID=285107 RepID=UPI000B548C32|nr:MULTISPECIES: helix-turn-helix domain-containing GNAT family N-acetyltransferase [Thioclava]OWY05790.1 PadR family transcriptional regulator [Thioclava sp. F1Mire-8]OWY11085.1 PadR family transcriptional regulator [Thioclava sp. F42-5]OWY13844.1 PadR family transcriptional regulator [Thioclava sp. F34-6]WGT51063.1 helix-turn-helix domain-containing GNAT family N-acetyltransferase [Thioclava nitratireducens]
MDSIARIRRFNRAVTRQLGALNSSFLGRGRPLGSARVLNLIGRGQGDVAKLREALALDSGQMSRLLRGLEGEGLIVMEDDPEDGRRRIARLTDAGQAEFAEYERLSDAQAADILSRHPDHAALLGAMDLIATSLTRSEIEIVPCDPLDPRAQSCLAKYYAELSARFDGGFDVSLSKDPEAAEMRPPHGTFLIALSDGLPLGCAALKGGADYAEVKRVWIAPAARGLGLARQLMTALEVSARELGHLRLRLDTNSALPEAIAMYQRFGWHEIPRYNNDPYPDRFFEKRLLAQE